MIEIVRLLYVVIWNISVKTGDFLKFQKVNIRAPRPGPSSGEQEPRR